MEPPVLLDPDLLPDHAELFSYLVSHVIWDGRMRARKTASFGAAYNYSGMTYPVTPMPESLLPVADQVEARLGFRPNNCLVNYYPDGEALMGFHSDSEADLVTGTGVAIVSLGAERSLTFRSKDGERREYRFRLESGSLLYMPPGMQEDWKHALLPEPATSGRISLTFRLLR